MLVETRANGWLERCKSAYATHREDACQLHAVICLQDSGNLLLLGLGCFGAK